MAFKNMFKVFAPKGYLWSKKKGTVDGRKGYDDVQEALDDLAKRNCCGINCCEGSIYLKTATGVPVKITVEITEGGPTFVFSTPETPE